MTVGQVETLRRPTRRRLGRDLADAVGPQKRPHPVVVAERVRLGEDMVAHRLVHRSRRAVQEGTGLSMVLHEPGQPTAVGLQVDIPVVGLGDREVQDVVGIGGKPFGLAVQEVDHDASDPAVLQAPAGRGVVEAGRAVDLVVTRQRARQWLGDLSGDPGDDDLRPLERCRVHVRDSPRLSMSEVSVGLGRAETTTPTEARLLSSRHRRAGHGRRAGRRKAEVTTWFESQVAKPVVASRVLGTALLGTALAACSSGTGRGPRQRDQGQPATSTAHVLTVGTFDGHAGKYRTIQDAVDAARRGDWILVAPGDYHETDDETSRSASTDHGKFGGVLITTSDIHLRGMDRNTVIVDGTKAGRNHPVQRGAGPAGPRRRRVGRQGQRTQRHRRVEGRQREHREPHGLQLPQWRRRLGQRDLVERRCRLRSHRPARIHRSVPHRHIDLLPGRGHRGAIRDLLLQRPRARFCGTSSTPATSTTPGCTWGRASRSAA